jgi:hypothetical protein
MNPRTLERSSEIACNLVMTVLSLALVAGYVCLFHVFRADRQLAVAPAVEQQAVAAGDAALSYQEKE